MLFENRLGGQVYRPIGMEWAEQGYWKIYDHPATQAQFLAFGSATPDNTRPLNNVEGLEVNYAAQLKPEDYTGELPKVPQHAPRHYNCYDIDSGKTNKAITLESFFAMKIDFVIASIPQHIEPFRDLANRHPSKPKLIYQIGNSWNITPQQEALVDGILSSANIGWEKKNNPNFIQYHQEFDTGIFNPWVEGKEGQSYQGFDPKKITSFVNCFSTDGLFAHDWHLFQEVEKLMPEWEFRAMGGQCRNGSANGSRELAKEMLDSQFIWHTKLGGDGYGHVIHNSAAVARPLIVKKEYYIGKLADALIEDGETAIVIDGLSPQEIVKKIEYYSEPNRYHSMCHLVHSNFENVVNFDREFFRIKQFLENLL